MTRTEGTIEEGKSPEVCPNEGAFGSKSADAAPVASNNPAYGAAIPPKASHGLAPGASSAWSVWVAAWALTGLVVLPPSM